MRMKRASRIAITLVAVLLLVLTAACAPAPGEVTPTPAPEEVTPAPAPSPEEVTPIPPSEEITPPPTPELPPEGMGILEIRVTDPPHPEFSSIVVSIDPLESIKVHKVVPGESGEWIDVPLAVMENNEVVSSFDLVTLVGVTQTLGAVATAAGSFTQIRLYIDTVMVTPEGSTPQSATLPSGILRIVRPFGVQEGLRTVLTLDFDGDKSVVMTGEGKFLFRPVVKLAIEYEVALAPIVTTNAATDITTTSATLNGSLDDLGSFTSVDVSFEYGTTSGALDNETSPEEMSETGAFSAALTGLSPNTTYYFRAKAEAHGIISYGDELSFTTHS